MTSKRFIVFPFLLVLSAVLAVSISISPAGLAIAQTHSTKHGACLASVPLTEAAERQEGGSLFEPATAMATKAMPMQEMKHTAEGMQQGSQKMKHDSGEMKQGNLAMKHEVEETGGESMASMGEAHFIHETQYGGLFYMAPNKIHHVEGSYSEKCGFTVVIYNAHTNPIRVDRFRAIVKYVPEDEDEFEAIRFLSPSEDGSVLRATGTPDIEGPFEIELYVQFPGSDVPEMFNISVAH